MINLDNKIVVIRFFNLTWCVYNNFSTKCSCITCFIKLSCHTSIICSNSGIKICISLWCFFVKTTVSIFKSINNFIKCNTTIIYNIIIESINIPIIFYNSCINIRCFRRIKITRPLTCLTTCSFIYQLALINPKITSSKLKSRSRTTSINLNFLKSVCRNSRIIRCFWFRNGCCYHHV